MESAFSACSEGFAIVDQLYAAFIYSGKILRVRSLQMLVLRDVCLIALQLWLTKEEIANTHDRHCRAKHLEFRRVFSCKVLSPADLQPSIPSKIVSEQLESLSNRGYVLMLEEALAMESSPQGRRVRTLLRVLKSLCTRRRPDADVS